MLRLVTALARTAAGYGADVLTHARARVAPRRTDGFKTVTLTLNDRTREVSAAGVVNATGVWAGDIESDVTVTPSRGTHIVVDAEKVGNPTGALTVAVPGSINRFWARPLESGHRGCDQEADLSVTGWRSSNTAGARYLHQECRRVVL